MLRRLYEAVAAVCPIDGVSGEQGAVRIDYRPEATEGERAAAVAAVAAFDWSEQAQEAWDLGRRMAEAGQLLGSVEPVPVGVRVTLRVIVDHFNEQMRAIAAGQPPVPLLEGELLSRVAAGLASGLGLPDRPDVSP